VNLNGDSYLLNLFDTAGQEDWDTLRVMAYPDTDVILLCFSVVRPDSMENIVSKWIPELNRYIPKALIVLVGTQIDLRDQHNQQNQEVNTPGKNAAVKQYITTREGEELRQRIKAFKYVECSAVTQYNIKEVFDTCIEAIVYRDSDKENGSQCCFESLFITFRNSIRRRFNLRSRNSTNGSANSNGSTKKSKNNKKKAAKYS
jgi:small GTP-binding protein